MLNKWIKKQEVSKTFSSESHSEVNLAFEKIVSSLDDWNSGFQYWMGSIIYELKLKQVEIEALTASAKIGGWLADEEASELFKLSSWTPKKNAVCCELGSWLGKSSVILGKALKYKQNATLYCIDPFNLVADEPWHKSTFQEQAGPTHLSRYQVVKNTIKANQLDEVVTLIEGFAENVIHNFNQEIDLLFIDADHSYESVLRDYKNWSPLIKSGGFIAFHDYHQEGGAHDGPRRVVNECIVGNPEWKNQWLVNSLYVAQKD